MATATFDVVEIATQAIEAVGTIVSAMASFKMLEVAEDNYKLWRDQKEYYYNTFQLGVERPVAQEVFSIPKRVLDYTGQAQTIYDANTGALGGKAGNIGGWWDRHAAMYHTTRDTSIKELDSDTAKLQSDWANYLFRFEEHFTDIFNDTRWNKRLAVHNAGIKTGTNVSAALSTSFSVYEQAIAGVGDQFATMANGAAAYSGYRRGMADTNADFTESGYRRNITKPSTQTFGLVNNDPVITEAL